MTHKDVSDIDRVEIVHMYNEGVPPNDVAAELDMPVATIWRVLKQAGVKRKRGRQSLLDRMSEAEVEAFVEDYQEGELPNREIAEKYDLAGVASVYSLLAQLRITPRTYTKEHLEVRKLRLDHAISLYQDYPHMTVSAIVLETGIDQPSLHHELHKRKIKTRREKAAEETNKLLKQKKR